MAKSQTILRISLVTKIILGGFSVIGFIAGIQDVYPKYQKIGLFIGCGSALLFCIELLLEKFAAELIEIKLPELYRRLKGLITCICLQDLQKKEKNVFPLVYDMLETITKEDSIFATSTFYPGNNYESKLISKVSELDQILDSTPKIILTRIICKNPQTDSWIEAIKNLKEEPYITLRKLMSKNRIKIYCIDGYFGLDILLIQNNKSAKVIFGIKEDNIHSYGEFGKANTGMEAKGKTLLYENNLFAESMERYFNNFLVPFLESEHRSI
jgi:hypothetical protein